jgi:hypothetical protein
MKFFIAFLLVFLSISDGTAVPTNIVRDPPGAYNVTVNVTWTFSSEAKITYVVMTISSLKSSQYAAMGLGQNQAMVNIKE